MLRCTPVFFGRVVVEVDVEFTQSIFRPPSLQPLKGDGTASTHGRLSYSNSQLEWLVDHYMKSPSDFMKRYPPA
jgi:hypothetical protein